MHSMTVMNTCQMMPWLTGQHAFAAHHVSLGTYDDSMNVMDA